MGDESDVKARHADLPRDEVKRTDRTFTLAPKVGNIWTGWIDWLAEITVISDSKWNPKIRAYWYFQYVTALHLQLR